MSEEKVKCLAVNLRASKAFISCISPSPPPPLPPLDRLESLLPPDPGGLLSSWGKRYKMSFSSQPCGSLHWKNSLCLIWYKHKQLIQYWWNKTRRTGSISPEVQPGRLTLCTLRSLAPANAAASPEGWCCIPGGPPGGPPPVGSGGGMGGGTAIGGGGPGGGGGAGGPAMGAGTTAGGGATESIAGWPAETGGPGRGTVINKLMVVSVSLEDWPSITSGFSLCNKHTDSWWLGRSYGATGDNSVFIFHILLTATGLLLKKMI